MSILGIVGIGGCARDVMPMLTRVEQPDQLRFVIEDALYTGQQINGVRCMDESSFLALKDEKRFNIAIANTKERERLAGIFEASGAIPCPIVGKQTIVGPDVKIGIGSIISQNCMVTANVRIGRYFHCNYYSYVAHDCVIGDFVTFAPRVSCNGCVHIDHGAYIGSGAIIRDGTLRKPIRIGRHAVVGMGAVVTADVPDRVTVVGNPARIIS